MEIPSSPLNLRTDSVLCHIRYALNKDLRKAGNGCKHQNAVATVFFIAWDQPIFMDFAQLRNVSLY